MTLALVGIFVSLALLIALAYRGHSVIVLAPLMALLAVLLAGAPILANYTQVFMPALAGFIAQFFPLFLTGAIFGKLMADSGYAQDFAAWISRLLGPQHALLVTVIATALLTSGGVSAWVIVFTIFPIARSLFEQADIPRRLMPAAIALGIFTFATAALPGSPQIHNTIPTRFFQTNTFAAPFLGIIGAAITFGLGMLWLWFRQRRLVAAGESFGDLTHAERRTGAVGPVGDEMDHLHTPDREPDGSARRGITGLAPVAVVVATNALLTYLVIPAMDTGYLAEKRYGGVALAQVASVWSVTAALVVASVVIFLMRPGSAGTYLAGLSEGAKNAVIPVFTTASEVAYGATIASLAAFALVRDGIFAISDNALVTSVLSTSVIAAVTGSASGGLTISLNTFGEQLVQMATAQGISMDLMHRATAMASVGFDSPSQRRDHHPARGHRALAPGVLQGHRHGHRRRPGRRAAGRDGARSHLRQLLSRATVS
ncbi:GntP family permease [Mobilicoccus caccae]|uniref:Citrate transporter n=1 Tax=Mobilicoccus caccae TaxID=1859295 RepID=A0ABQ6IRY6_9MICO|nr:GntP family permease [Mobilicoccus caccae]GMA39487.1 citrate transporter [Mobilicoccus caccae]